MQVEVVGAVIVKDNKVLAARRPFEKTLGGLWEFPGGKIEENESHELALKREIEEELSCSINVEEFIIKEIYKYDFATIALSTYFCTLKNGSPIIGEHMDLKWLDVSELDSVEWAPADYPTLEMIKNYRLGK